LSLSIEKSDAKHKIDATEKSFGWSLAAGERDAAKRRPGTFVGYVKIDKTPLHKAGFGNYCGCHT
jgi:hypothetical protein